MTSHSSRGPLFVAAFLAAAALTHAEPPSTTPSPTPSVRKDVPYRERWPGEPDARRTLADVYRPAGGQASAVVVLWHGGGLMNGDKSEVAGLARVLAAEGVCVVAANYRLSPAAKYPAYVQDAAAAVAWSIDHAAGLGATPDRVFAAGYSAGGYLACVLGTDARWLSPHGRSPKDLAGVIALSPQVFTHYAIRRERGEKDWEWTPLIDAAAPVYHASADAAPMRLFCGDHDTPTRREEIEYFVSLLKYRKHADTRLTVVPGRTHGSIYGEALKAGDPVQTGILDFVRTHAAGPATRPAR